MEHRDDGKTVVIELKKNAENAKSKEDDINLTHSSIFPVKPPKTSFFRTPTFLAAVFLLLFIVAVFLLISTIGCGYIPEETTASTTDPETEMSNAELPSVPAGAFYVNGLQEAASISGIQSKFALLARADTLEAIATKNGAQTMYPASMTKIMTFLVAYDALSDKLDKQLTLTQEIRKQYPEGSRIGIDVGDLLTVEQCMYAMLLRSDTDAVLMLVEETAGTEAAFAELMNRKAEELYLSRTHFTNSNGLHDEKHYTTAAEMSVIFATALKNELFRTIISANPHITYLGYYDNGTYKTYRMTFFNSTLSDRFERNNISTKLGSGVTVLGGKTGFTDEGGYCQAALATDAEGNEYVAILGLASSAKQSALDTAYVFENYIQ